MVGVFERSKEYYLGFDVFFSGKRFFHAFVSKVGFFKFPPE